MERYSHLPMCILNLYFVRYVLYLSSEIVKRSHNGTFKKPGLEKQSQNAISAKESVCHLVHFSASGYTNP